MFHFFNRFSSVAALVASSFLFSGCVVDKTQIAFPYLQPAPDEQEIQEIHEADDPDLRLVTTEPDTTLNQELEALSETGQWGEKTTTLEAKQQPAVEPLYDFPIVMNKQVEMYLDLFQNQQRKHFQRWLARSGKYIPMMERKLQSAGLPKDLVYLSMIESGYNQRAYSRARAVGLWQFMRATGRQYHLSVDSYIDERRDSEKSTDAAVQFLSDLYAEFGDWHLAVAAYNAGPGKIRNGLRRYKVDNFWDLAKHRYLRLETKRYVPKLIAAIILARDAESYGFTNIPYARPLDYDTFDVGPGMSLEAVALIAGSSTKTIKELNQELRKAKTPPNKTGYAVKIPAGSHELAAKNMQRLHSYVSTGYTTHTIKKGESLASICREYEINTTTLLKVNNLHSSKLRSGTNLRIPYTTVKYQLLPEGSDRQQFAANSDNLILHRIKTGETISKIAKKYGVPQEMIVSWNGIKSVHRIRAGQQLALFIENSSNSSGQSAKGAKRIIASANKRMVTEKNDFTQLANPGVRILTADKKGSPDIIEPEPVYSWYKVRSGDSLWTISRRFNTSAAQIKKLNKLKSNLIRPGSRLKVKKV